jgi:hypothetical protein
VVRSFDETESERLEQRGVDEDVATAQVRADVVDAPEEHNPVGDPFVGCQAA